jgi:hypothetical protein
MERINSLFQEIKELQEHYHELEHCEAYGFNIFSVLLKSGDEVNLHTKFIYELLNPTGTHRQGRLFLELFLQELSLDIPQDRVDVFREKENIDILLQSTETSIIVENKIYTQDHSSQLSRYWKNIHFQGYKESNIHLIYLTLFGEQPLETIMQDKVCCISYKKEIVKWLERCVEETQKIPILRETLVQYLNLVKELTHQSKEKGLVMEIKELLLKENNLESILAIESSIIEAKIEVQFNFWQILLSNLFPHYAFSFYNTNNDKGLKSSIRRYYQQQKNIKDYGIKYQIDENLNFFIELRKNIYYGFEFLDEYGITQEQQEVLGNLDIEWREVTDTVYWRYPTKALNFKDFNHSNIFDLIDKEQREKDIKKISNEIIRLISQYKKQYKKDMLCLEK